jgi:beta-lactamase superfamily II metal-dependent hydrolase
VSVEELDLVVAFLDVGHGDSAVVRFREGHQVRTIVVDGGGPDHPERLLSYLLRNAITTVDLLVASHIDRNHIAGLVPLVESDRVTVHHFWGPGCESTQPSVSGLRTTDERTYQRIYARVTQRVRPDNMVCPTRGMPLPKLFTDATVTVLNPPRANVLKPPPKNAPARKPEELALEQNELALVLHVESHGLRVLFPSDVEGAFWGNVLQDGSLQRYLDVNILKVPNFGQSSGLPLGVMQFVNTDYAVLSLGAATDKQPSLDILNLMQERGAEVICTQHPAKNSFCRNPHCPAAQGGQNIVFCRRKGDSSYSTSAYFCPLLGSGEKPGG